MLENAVIHSAALTELVTLKECKVIVADMVKISITYLAPAPRALAALCACNTCRVDVLAGKSLLFKVGALAALILEINNVQAFASAGGHKPSPSLHMLYLVSMLYEQDDPALFAGTRTTR